jgi:hypothetical protein
MCKFAIVSENCVRYSPNSFMSQAAQRQKTINESVVLHTTICITTPEELPSFLLQAPNSIPEHALRPDLVRPQWALSEAEFKSWKFQKTSQVTSPSQSRKGLSSSQFETQLGQTQKQANYTGTPVGETKRADE